MNIEQVREVIENHEKHYAHQGTVKFECNAKRLYEVIKDVMPLVEAAINLHEFNEGINIVMSPKQEMEKVHLFDDYIKAVEKLVAE